MADAAVGRAVTGSYSHPFSYARKSGFAAAKFLHERKALVRVTEGAEKKEALENASYLRSLGIDVETGGHTEAFVTGSACVVTSPGVPRHASPLEWTRKKKIPLISEVELASYFCQGRIVAVTGSNGKTTTCNLIHRILSEAGRDSVLCGNVGFSFLEALPRVQKKTIVVLELSSFQLQDSPTLRPQIAVVLNIHPNHLDRHGTVEHYALAKENIFLSQKAADTLLLNGDDARVRQMAERARSRVVFFSAADEPSFRPERCGLKGRHNLLNMLAASAVARLLRVPVRKMQKTLENFKTLEHRIEPLGEVSGVRFVNDSKSTTVESTRAALEAVDGRAVLIAGGRDKGASFADLEPMLEDKLRLAVLYGEAREKIAGAWKSFIRVKTEKDFASAFRLAFEEARPGDTVLLSPMCTSFDQFSSFEERGEAFRHLVQDLKKSREGE